MAAKLKQFEFDPNRPYHVSEVAEMYNKTVDWVRREWIKTGILEHFPAGNDEIILGIWLTAMAKNNSTRAGDANYPENNRGKHLRKKQTKDKPHES